MMTELDQNTPEIILAIPTSVQVLLHFTAEIEVFDCGLLPQAQGWYVILLESLRAAANEASTGDPINRHTLSDQAFKCITVLDPIKGRRLGRAHQMNSVEKGSHTGKSPQPSAQGHPAWRSVFWER